MAEIAGLSRDPGHLPRVAGGLGRNGCGRRGGARRGRRRGRRLSALRPHLCRQRAEPGQHEHDLPVQRPARGRHEPQHDDEHDRVREQGGDQVHQGQDLGGHLLGEPAGGAALQGLDVAERNVDEARQKRAEDDLRKNEQEKIAILDSLIEHVVYHDSQMKIL